MPSEPDAGAVLASGVGACHRGWHRLAPTRLRRLVAGPGTLVMASLSEIYAELRIACRAAGSQQAWAEAHGISPQYVSDVLNARRDPGDKILAALGYVRVVTYEKSSK